MDEFGGTLLPVGPDLDFEPIFLALVEKICAYWPFEGALKFLRFLCDYFFG